MSESRISQLLKNSRSRHADIKNPQLLKIAHQFKIQKQKRKHMSYETNKKVHEISYLEKMDLQMNKNLSNKKKQLCYVQNVRKRLMEDINKKRYLEELRQKELQKNKQLAMKVKEDRKNRIKSWKFSIFKKLDIAENQRKINKSLRLERDQLRSQEFSQNKDRVQKIIQFECNLKDSFIKLKEQNIKRHINHYKKGIDKQKMTINMKLKLNDQLSSKAKLLLQNTSRKLSQMNFLSQSIRKIKTETPVTMYRKQSAKGQTSRCYTTDQYTFVHEKVLTYDNSNSINVSQQHYHTEV